MNIVVIYHCDGDRGCDSAFAVHRGKVPGIPGEPVILPAYIQLQAEGYSNC